MSIKTILYSEKNTSANTIYADITVADKMLMLDKISKTFYEVLEKANYDTAIKKALFHKDPIFRKHLSSGQKNLDNSLVSFLSGLLKQHYNNPNKDISTKMLQGISFATEVLNHIVPECPHYQFKKENSQAETTQFEKLFG